MRITSGDLDWLVLNVKVCNLYLLFKVLKPSFNLSVSFFEKKNSVLEICILRALKGP